jgi:uncharacterized membrane protein YeaQ/YmgE (transglycosylase-associated protein family)
MGAGPRLSTEGKHFMSMGIFTWIVLGLVAGWLAGQFMRGGYGLVGDIVLGIVGAVVGGYVGGLILGRDLMVTGFNLESVVVAFVGAVVLIAISRMFIRRRRFGLR